jgi:hypothetical protein
MQGEKPEHIFRFDAVTAALGATGALTQMNHVIAFTTFLIRICGAFSSYSRASTELIC